MVMKVYTGSYKGYDLMANTLRSKFFFTRTSVSAFLAALTSFCTAVTVDIASRAVLSTRFCAVITPSTLRIVCYMECPTRQHSNRATQQQSNRATEQQSNRATEQQSNTATQQHSNTAARRAVRDVRIVAVSSSGSGFTAVAVGFTDC